ncbi:MAG TPA: hypothetical protein PKD55_16855 [Bellilinea sp.]|nr:hypothetical protein [Bellilinea sp.]
MKIICCSDASRLDKAKDHDLQILLYGRTQQSDRGSIGANIKDVFGKEKLLSNPRAWDLMSLALSVIAADTGVRRNSSPDGWTRELDLDIAVSDPSFWNTQKKLVEQQLQFLTTDRWHCNFFDAGFVPAELGSPVEPTEDCVALLSGGLDSLIGALDLVSRENRSPLVVSHITRGDKRIQSAFASDIGGGLRHLQFNHNATVPTEREISQRARSLIFLAYGTCVATTLNAYHKGEIIPLFVPENGFISINPPLTEGRIGSLSTRTTHPIFISQYQRLLDKAGLRVQVENPYQFSTKGEMFIGCANQAFLEKEGHKAISCGRYARYGYRHCGRCVPCLVRRAAFHAWGKGDRSDYEYVDLSLDDNQHARYDDVRSMAMAITQVNMEGIDSWLAPSLNTTTMGNVDCYKETVERGLREIEGFFRTAGVL